jgi:hypothetical protein
LKEFRELLSRCAFVVVERAKKKAGHVSKPMIAAPKFIYKSFEVHATGPTFYSWALTLRAQPSLPSDATSLTTREPLHCSKERRTLRDARVLLITARHINA